MKHLLLISCSQRKNDITLSKAIDLYNGPYYQIIKKLRRENNFPSNLDLYILSAKHGIIHESSLIEFYDLKMDDNRAKELNKESVYKLKSIIEKERYNTVFINLGKTYMKSIQGYESIIPESTNIIVCSGQIGERMSSMKKWIITTTKGSD